MGIARDGMDAELAVAVQCQALATFNIKGLGPSVRCGIARLTPGQLSQRLPGEGISIGQVIDLPIAEKRAALVTEERLKPRAARNDGKFNAVLKARDTKSEPEDASQRIVRADNRRKSRITRKLKLTWPSLRSGPRSLTPVVRPTEALLHGTTPAGPRDRGGAVGPDA
jgi:hypothetical protein